MTCTLFADCVIFFLENQGHIEDEKAYWYSSSQRPPGAKVEEGDVAR
jgi:hypothetical protein